MTSNKQFILTMSTTELFILFPEPASPSAFLISINPVGFIFKYFHIWPPLTNSAATTSVSRVTTMTGFLDSALASFQQPELSHKWSKSDHVIHFNGSHLTLRKKQRPYKWPTRLYKIIFLTTSSKFLFLPCSLYSSHTGLCAAPLTHEECFPYKDCFSAWNFPFPISIWLIPHLLQVFSWRSLQCGIFWPYLKLYLFPTLQIPLPCFIFF